MNICIKNMVCNRCILVVKQVLQSLNLQPVQVSLGEVVLSQKLSTAQIKTLSTELQKLGFEILDTHQQRLIEKIKALLIAQIQSDSL